MKFSVITVCFNNRHSIVHAMDSVLAQQLDGNELEYIVVDGGSSDDAFAADDIVAKIAAAVRAPLT